MQNAGMSTEIEFQTAGVAPLNLRRGIEMKFSFQKDEHVY